MKLFIFKIHEDCSYVDGALLIVARSYGKAIWIYERHAKEEGKSNIYEHPIFRHRPKKLEGDIVYKDPWYLAHTVELKDSSAEESILLTAYSRRII